MTSSAIDDAALRLHLAELTPRQRELAVEAAGSLERVMDTRAPSVRARGRRARAVTEALEVIGPRELETERRIAQRRGARIVTRDDPSWPPLLRESPDPPWALWVKGELPDPLKVPLAVVGSRRPTPYGVAVTKRLASELAALGAVVVSGGARGIDAAAHEAALDVGGITVAVLGCGVDVAYPREHARLFERIAERGAVVSEHPCGTPPLPHHFPIRNRVLAGWVRAVVVTEASLRSGSLITARLALEQGRDVLAVPGPVTSPTSEGTNELIARGARLARDVADVLGELAPPDRAGLLERLAPAAPGAGRPPADPDDPVLAALSPGQPATLDDLAARTGLPAGQLLSRLVRLEESGHVTALAGSSWVRG